MKKFSYKIFGIAIISTLALTTCAYANSSPISVSNDEDSYTVTVSGLNSDENTTLFIVKSGVPIKAAFDDVTKVVHIDQDFADNTGKATFAFTYTGDDSLDIYSGYETMSGNDKPFKTVLDLSGSGGDVSGEFMYGDVNNDASIDTVDAVAVLENFLYGTGFTDTSGKEYEYGKTAADVNDDSEIDTVDAVAILENFLNGTPFGVSGQ